MNPAGHTRRDAAHVPASPVVRRQAALLVLLVGLVVGGCRGVDSGASIGRQTDWNDAARGQMAQRVYLHSRTLSRQPQQKQLLEQVGARLAAVAERPTYDWNFQLVDDPQPDVVVFPGGNVVVTEGLIAACDNEAEFAAALSHELGHMLAGHPMRRPTQSGPGSPRIPPAQATGGDPQDEIEADSIAMSLLARAGYEPRALVSFRENANANPERTAFLATRGERHIPTARLNVALSQAQQIYSANQYRQGLGIQIVRDESTRPRQPETGSLAGDTDRREIRWTAAADRPRGGRLDPHGAGKPVGWNADLLDDGDWLLPVEGEIQQAGFEWSPAVSGR